MLVQMRNYNTRWFEAFVKGIAKEERVCRGGRLLSRKNRKEKRTMHPDRLCPMPEVSAGLHLFLRHIQTLPYRFISVASCRLGLLHIGFVPVFPGLDLFARLAASRLPPHIATPSHQAFRSSSRRHCWSNVEVEDGFASGLRGSGVVVDHVSNLLLDSICFSDNVPIVAIKRWFGSKPHCVSNTPCNLASWT